MAAVGRMAGRARLLLEQDPGGVPGLGAQQSVCAVAQKRRQPEGQKVEDREGPIGDGEADRTRAVLRIIFAAVVLRREQVLDQPVRRADQGHEVHELHLAVGGVLPGRLVGLLVAARLPLSAVSAVADTRALALRGRPARSRARVRRRRNAAGLDVEPGAPLALALELGGLAPPSSKGEAGGCTPRRGRVSTCPGRQTSLPVRSPRIVGAGASPQTVSSRAGWASSRSRRLDRDHRSRATPRRPVTRARRRQGCRPLRAGSTRNRRPPGGAMLLGSTMPRRRSVSRSRPRPRPLLLTGSNPGARCERPASSLPRSKPYLP